jgi:hypothetical protein
MQSLWYQLWQPAQENIVLSPKTDPLWSLSNSKVSSCRLVAGLTPGKSLGHRTEDRHMHKNSREGESRVQHELNILLQTIVLDME